MTSSRSPPVPPALVILLTPLTRRSREAGWTLVFAGVAWIIVVALLPSDIPPWLWLPGFALKTIGFVGVGWSRSSTSQAGESDAEGG